MLRLAEKSKTRHWSCDWGDLKASKQALQEQIAHLLLQSLRKLLEWMISNGNLPTKLYPFFICNVYSNVSRLHREKPIVVWSNFLLLQCTILYSVCEKKGKLTWILCYVSCFVIMECNCTIWPLYFKNTLFFTSIYLYVSMYVCTEKENKCLFFIL